MPNLAERLLSSLTDRPRAAAMIGDLEELAQTRGRRWFWIAYARTLITLGWRTPVAFLLAYAFSTWIALGGFPTIYSLFHSFYRNVHHKPHAAFWHVFDRTAHHTAAHAIWQIPLGDSLIALWFILPFVLIRFGIRDRVTQLATALFVFTMPFFSLSPAGVNFAGFVTVAIFLGALCLRAWRRPMIVLAASIAPIAVALLLSPKIWYLFTSRGYGFESPQLQRAMALYRAAEICAAAIVCSSLYSHLVEKKPNDLSTVV